MKFIEYEIDSFGKIKVLDNHEKHEWSEFKNDTPAEELRLQGIYISCDFIDALEIEGARTLKRFETPSHLVSKEFDIEDLIQRLTGLRCNSAAKPFFWEKYRYYAIRPDFTILCAKSNLCEKGVNGFEWQIRKRFLKHEEVFEKIFKLMSEGKITPASRRPMDWWNEHFHFNGSPLLPEDNDNMGENEPSNRGRPERGDWALQVALAAVVYHSERSGKELASDNGFFRRLTALADYVRRIPGLEKFTIPARSSFVDGPHENVLDAARKASEIYTQSSQISAPRA